MSESIPIPAPDPEQRTRQATQTALRALLKKPLSEQELQKVLQQHAYSREIIQKVLQAVHAWGYLNDAQLAASIRASAIRRGKGPAWITQTLGQRGIHDTQAQQSAHLSDGEALQHATELLRKRLARQTAFSQKEAQKALRFLAARGFSRNCAYQALHEVLRAKDHKTFDDIF